MAEDSSIDDAHLQEVMAVETNSCRGVCLGAIKAGCRWDCRNRLRITGARPFGCHMTKRVVL